MSIQLNMSGLPQNSNPVKTEEQQIRESVISGKTIPLIRDLRGNIITLLDACIVNKDQNRAIRKMVSTYFDQAYLAILRAAYPDKIWNPDATL